MGKRIATIRKLVSNEGILVDALCLTGCLGIVTIALLSLRWSYYYYGYYRDELFLNVFFLIFIDALLFIIVYSLLFKRVFYFLFRKRILSMLFSIVMMIATPYLSYLLIQYTFKPMYLIELKGCQDYFVSHLEQSDCEEIITWMNTYDGENGFVSEAKRSDVIKHFNPNYVFYKEKNGQKGVLLEWGGPFGHFGLFVSGAADQVEPGLVYEKEYRLPVNEMAFVTYEIQ